MGSKGSTVPRDGTPTPLPHEGADQGQVRPPEDGPAAQNEPSEADQGLVVAVGYGGACERRDEDQEAVFLNAAAAGQARPESHTGRGEGAVKGGALPHGGASGGPRQAGGEVAANRGDDKDAERGIGSGTGRKKRAAAEAALSSFARGGGGAVSVVGHVAALVIDLLVPLASSGAQQCLPTRARSQPKATQGTMRSIPPCAQWLITTEILHRGDESVTLFLLWGSARWKRHSEEGEEGSWDGGGERDQQQQQDGRGEGT